MKALSLWQPWATLMARSLKCFETRHWELGYRGDVIIHAARRNEIEMLDVPEFALLRRLSLPLGAALCVAELVKIYRTEDVRELVGKNERAYGDYSDNRRAWLFKNVRPFTTPIPMKGQQGLFEVDMDKLLFDLVIEDKGWYEAALETLISIHNIPALRLNAANCKAEIIRRLCHEALDKLGAPPDDRPKQLQLF